MPMKIVSWNVNSLNVRQSQVLDYLESHHPAVLGLQELKQTDEAVKREAFIQSAPENVVRGIPNNEDDPQARAIAASYGDLRVLNLYVPNGKAVGDEKYHYKLGWLEKLQAYVARLLQEYPKLVVIGDFNIAPADIDVHDPKAWQDKILCSAPERQALQALFDLGLTDAFRARHPERQQFSWWDYRMGGLRRNLGLRIDLTLISPALQLIDADIDMAPREQERPSDHAPAWVEIQ